MTGGMAFILDEEGSFPSRANPESIQWQRLASTYWEQRLRSLIAAHAVATDSKWSNTILDDWDRWRGRFWQVVPLEMVNRLDNPLNDSQAAEMVAAE
jgi:glutamate synthase (NADPH/NADH) large chain